MKEKIYQKILAIYLILVLVVIFINSILVTFEYLSISNYADILTILGFFAFVIYLIGLITKQIKYHYIDYLITILIVLGIISTVFAVNPEVSLFGYPGRYEGLLVLITYYLLFLLARNIKDKKKIIYFMLFLGGLQVIFAFIQTINYQYHFFKTREDLTYAYGFVGNSNFYGSLMCLCYGLNLGMTMFKEKIKWFDIFLVIFFSFGILLSGCMSAMVGIVCIYVSIVFYIIYSIIKKRKEYHIIIKRFILILLIFLSSYFICTNFFFQTIRNDVNEVFTQTKSIVTEQKTEESFGSGRFYIWENTLKEVPKYLFNGVGIDNFAYAFDGNQLFLKGSNIYFDKAHNEYLQVLITEGLPALIVYLCILFIVFFSNVFKIEPTKDRIQLALLFAFFAYISQAFFNISITRVAPMFWIIMGLLMGSKNNLKKNIKNIAK